MMQSAQLRQSNYRTQYGRLNSSRRWRVLVQRQMRPGMFVVLEVCFHNTSQARFVEGNDVVQEFLVGTGVHRSFMPHEQSDYALKV
jgi:hypothetical protein